MVKDKDIRRDIENNYEKQVLLKILHFLKNKKVICLSRKGIILESPCFNKDCSGILNYEKIIVNKNNFNVQYNKNIRCSNPKCNLKIKREEYEKFNSLLNFQGILLDFNMGDLTKDENKYIVIDHHDDYSEQNLQTATTQVIKNISKFTNGNKRVEVSRFHQSFLGILHSSNQGILSEDTSLNVFVNHFDVDALLSVFCFLNPQIALDNSDFFAKMSFYEDILKNNEPSQNYLKGGLKNELNVVDLSTIIENFYIYLIKKYKNSQKAFEVCLEFLPKMLENPKDFSKFKREAFRQRRIDLSILKRFFFNKDSNTYKKDNLLEIENVIWINYAKRIIPPHFIDFIQKKFKKEKRENVVLETPLFVKTIFTDKHNLKDAHSISISINPDFIYFKEVDLSILFDLVQEKQKQKVDVLYSQAVKSIDFLNFKIEETQEFDCFFADCLKFVTRLKYEINERDKTNIEKIISNA